MSEVTRDFHLDGEELPASNLPDRQSVLGAAIALRLAQRDAIGLGPDASGEQIIAPSVHTNENGGLPEES